MSESSANSSSFPEDFELQQWIDRVADDFEKACKETPSPDIARFLQDGDRRPRWLLLCELVRIDLEHRCRRGESVRIEDYLEQFPELADPEIGLPDELVLFARQAALRHQRPNVDRNVGLGDADPRVDDSPHRDLREELADAASDRQESRIFRCPHCDQPVEIDLRSSGRATVCPQCAGSIEFELPAVAPGAKLRLPRTLGKFQLLEFVGGGSFGTVFKARDSELGRIVAIKFPRIGVFQNANDEHRFLREARATAALRHPHIVQVHEVGREEGIPYIVSDFIDGKTLGDVLQQRAASQRQCLQWMCDIAGALHYAHTRHVIHRDVKPSNILVDRQDHPYITDFGLARQLDDCVQMTIDGEILGTPAYMSPEQAAGTSSVVDARSDVFSLGVVLYEMLTGERPFRGNVRMLLQQLVERDPRPLRELNDRIPRDAETICLKALAKSPSRRYQDSLQFADDLRRYLNDEPILARPVGRFERTWQWCRRNRRVAITYAAATLTVVAVTLIAFLLIDDARWTAVQQKNQAEDLAGSLATSLITSERLRHEAEDSRAAEAVARRNAERQTRIATANRLVVQSQAVEDDELSLLLSIEAVEATFHRDGEVVPAAHQNLRDTLSRIRGWPLSPKDPVHCMAYGPQQQWIATGHADGTVHIWDLESDNPFTDRRTFRGLDGKISGIAVSPDGLRLVASSGTDLMTWELDGDASAREGIALRGHTSFIRSLVFGLQSQRLATVDWEENIRVWNLDSEDPSATAHTIPGKESEEWTEAEISPDGRWVVTTSDASFVSHPLGKMVRLFDVTDSAPGAAEILLADHVDGMQLARFDTSGKWVVASSSGRVLMWDLSAARPEQHRREFRGERPSIDGIDFDPRGRWMLISQSFGTSSLLDLTSDDPPNSRRALVRPSSEFRSDLVQFSPDGKWLVCSYSYAYKSTLHLWTLDDPTAAPIDIPCFGVRVKRIAFTHDSQWLACEWADGAIREYPLNDDDPVSGAVSVGNWSDLALAGRRTRWSVTRGDGIPRLLETEAPESIGAMVLRGHQKYPGGAPFFELEGKVTTIAIDHSGNRALTAGADGSVRLWDLTSSSPTRSAVELYHSDDRGLAALSPNGEWAVSGAAERNELQLWDLADPNQPASTVLQGHEGDATHAIFTRDSAHLITADRCGEVRIWRLTDSSPVESEILADSQGSIRCMAMDGNGKHIAAGRGDGTVTVIVLGDDGSADRLMTFPAHRTTVTSIFVDDQGARLWTGSEDGLVTMWTLSDNGSARSSLQLQHDPRSQPRIYSIAVDPQGRWIAACTYRSIRVWDLAKDDPAANSIELSGSVAAFDASGRWLACDDQLWDLAHPQRFKTPVVLRGHDEEISCLAVGGEARTLATGSKDATVRIWPFDIECLLDHARRAAGRDLTSDETSRYVH